MIERYLLRYFLMFVGMYESVIWLMGFYQLQRLGRQALTRSPDQELIPLASVRENPRFNLSWITAMTVLVVGVIGFRFQEMPFGKITTNAAGETIYKWGLITTKASNDGFVDGWARWNFTGYEGKTAYSEYRTLVETM